MAIMIGDVIRITANFLVQSLDEYVNVFHCEWDGVGGIDDDVGMGQIADDIDTAYQELVGIMTEDLAFVDIQGQNLTQSILLPTQAWPTLTVGLATGNHLPAQTAGYIFYRSTRPKTRAANYIPGLTEDGNSSLGTPTTALKAALQAFGDIAVTGFEDVVQHLIYGAYNRELDRFTPVNAAVVGVRFATQRRRGRGVEL